MTINQRLKEFIKYLGLSERKFFLKNDISEGGLRGKNIGSDKLATIIGNYPQLNIQWVLFGEGEMIKDAKMVSEERATYKKGVTLDELVDQKIQDKLEKVGDMLKEIITSQIEDEIEEVQKEISKNGQKH